MFCKNVLAADADIGDAVSDIVGDIVVAEKEEFEGKVLGLGAEFSLAVGKANAAFAEERDRTVSELSLFLECDLQFHKAKNGNTTPLKLFQVRADLMKTVFRMS